MGPLSLSLSFSNSRRQSTVVQQTTNKVDTRDTLTLCFRTLFLPSPYKPNLADEKDHIYCVVRRKCERYDPHQSSML